MISACNDDMPQRPPQQLTTTTQPVATQTTTTQKTGQIAQSKKNTPIDTLIFTDAKLTNCIKQHAKQRQWQNVTQITQLNCANKNIENLGGLQHLNQLQQLDLSQNQISLLAPIGALTELKRLNLAGNKIVDINPLSKLNKLTHLNLGQANKLSPNNNSIRDLSPINNLTALEHINISHNQINDISAVESLTNLAFIQLSHNQIRDISYLQSFNHTKSINLKGNNNITCAALNQLETTLYQGTVHRPNDCLFTLEILIVDLNIHDQQLKNCLLDTASSEGWTTISEVTALSCEQHNIQSLKGIENLKALTQLDLSGNQITDITPLLSLTTAQINLENNNQIACKRLDALEASVGRQAIQRPKHCAQLSQLSDLNFTDTAIEECVTYTAALYQWQTIDEMTSLYCPTELTVKIAQLQDLQKLTALNSVFLNGHLTANIDCQAIETAQQERQFTIDKPQHCR